MMLIRYLSQIGRYFIMLKEVFSKPTKWSMMKQLILKEIDDLIIDSLGIVSFISFFVGGVVAIQTALNLTNPLIPKYLIGFATRQSVVLEFAPTFISIIMAGKMGSFITSSIGTMRVTEQIDAMEVSGTNPFKYLVITRILAATLILPLLIIFGDAIALFGSALVENLKGNVSFLLYFNKVFDALKFSDIIPATIKSFFFGFAIGLVGCFKGYNCKKGTVGVGEASNSAVVYTSMLLFIIDFIAVFISDIFFEI